MFFGLLNVVDNYLATLLATFFSKIFTKMGFMLLAIKTMVMTAITVLVPTMMYNFFLRIMTEITDWALSQISDSSSLFIDSAYQFVGVGAYLFIHWKIGESLTVVLSAIVISWLFALIPFIGKH